LTRVGRWQTVRIDRDNAFREIDSAEGQARLKAIEKALALLREMKLWMYYGPAFQKWLPLAQKADPRNESAVPESLFEVSWLLRFVGTDPGQLKPKQVAEIVAELEAWKKAHPFKDPDRAAMLHLQAATLLGVTHQTAEAAKYIDAALAYQPKNQELREELAGIAAALRGVGAGTGFVVATGGLVLTNRHVIEGAKKVAVQIPERKEPVAAKVIASDSRRDLALLKLDLPADLTLAPIPVARRTVGRGAKVGAFGFPVTGAGGSGLKLTTGIISAEPDDSTRGMLLLDCRINPGNSGGPLCDVRGNVVGVVTAKSVGGYGVESFGMALPSDVVHGFLSEHLPQGQKLAPPVRAKKVLEWDEIDAQVKASVLLIVHAQ
jgi:S1-C subfamily serine protease